MYISTWLTNRMLSSKLQTYWIFTLKITLFSIDLLHLRGLTDRFRGGTTVWPWVYHCVAVGVPLCARDRGSTTVWPWGYHCVHVTVGVPLCDRGGTTVWPWGYHCVTVGGHHCVAVGVKLCDRGVPMCDRGGSYNSFYLNV